MKFRIIMSIIAIIILSFLYIAYEASQPVKIPSKSTVQSSSKTEDNIKGLKF